MTVASINKTDQQDNSRPKHIVVVMDGNGRWAKKRLMPRTAGHHAGVKATRKVVEACVKEKITALTLFAFSTLQSEVKSLHKQNVRVRFIGECSAFSEKLQQRIKDAKELTQNNTGLQYCG